MSDENLTSELKAVLNKYKKQIIQGPDERTTCCTTIPDIFEMVIDIISAKQWNENSECIITELLFTIIDKNKKNKKLETISLETILAVLTDWYGYREVYDKMGDRLI